MDYNNWTAHMARIVAATLPPRTMQMPLGFDPRHAVIITPGNGSYLVEATDSDHRALITGQMIADTGVVIPTDFDDAADLLDNIIENYLAEASR